MLNFTHFTFFWGNFPDNCFVVSCDIWSQILHACASWKTCALKVLAWLRHLTPWGWSANQIDRIDRKAPVRTPELQLSLENEASVCKQSIFDESFNILHKINNIYNYFSGKNSCMFDSFTLLYIWILNWPNRQENRLMTLNKVNSTVSGQ